MKILREVALIGSLINFFILKLITFQNILNHVFRPVRFYGGSQKFKITKQQILTYKITDKQTDTNTCWWSNCTQALFSGWVKKKTTERKKQIQHYSNLVRFYSNLFTLVSYIGLRSIQDFIYDPPNNKKKSLIWIYVNLEN